MNTRVQDSTRNMRKMPQQKRSRYLVGVIVEVAARILADNGWDKFNTNEVARVAGVSIGSLYQYFPNKLALAEAIRRQHLDSVLQVLDKVTHPQPDKDKPADNDIEQMIDGIINAHLINPRLHLVLLDEVPLSGRSAHPEFERHYAEYYANFTAGYTGTERSALAGQVLASAVEGVVHQAARRGQLPSPAIRQELILLVSRYLKS